MVGILLRFSEQQKYVAERVFFLFSYLNHVILKVEFVNLRLSTEHNLYHLGHLNAQFFFCIKLKCTFLGFDSKDENERQIRRFVKKILQILFYKNGLYKRAQKLLTITNNKKLILPEV